MSCTNVFRTTCGNLNRASTLLSRRGHAHCYLEHRLVVGNGARTTGFLTPRHFASIFKACGPQNLEAKSIDSKKRERSDLFYSHSRCFGQGQTEVRWKSDMVKKLKLETLQRMKEGKVQVPDERDVTSLPPEVNLDNAQYIAVDVTTLTASPTSDLMGIIAVSDTEQFTKICRHNGSLSEYHRITMGFESDENGNNIRSSSGQLMEIAEPQEAVEEFLKFIKKYDNPVLLVYHGPPTAVQKLRCSFMRFGLYEEFIAASPFFIDVFQMARWNLPVGIVPSYRLQDLCKALLDMDIDTDPVLRVTGLKKLFTDGLLQRRFSPAIRCTDYFSAKDCYAEMVCESRIHPLTVQKLAHAGLRLDHLKFLKEQGYEEFEKQLKKYSIDGNDLTVLFTLVK